MNFDIQKIYENAIDFIFLYGPKMIGVIIVWIVGLWVIRIAGRGEDLIFKPLQTRGFPKNLFTQSVLHGAKSTPGD